MPKPKRKREILYQRGPYRLEWDRRRDGALRSPFLTVFWYDSAAGRERSRSTATTVVGEGIAALDRLYVERTEGLAYCPACGQLKQARAGYLVVDAIETYVTMVASKRSSSGEISHRLDWLLAYLETLPDAGIPCEAVDEEWIKGFREWALRQPVVGPKGNVLRDRAPSTVENSVIALAAAINDAFARHNTTGPARFHPIPGKKLNRSPQHRSAVDELARMFRHCLQPAMKPGASDKERTRRIRERAPLHRFLIVSVATLARPDAAHDVSTDPGRRQWNSEARILALNPFGRQQTKKYRATVPAPRQLAGHLDLCRGFFVGVQSVGGAWSSMATALGVPGGGQGGMKLIRRSMGKLLRDRLPKRDWPEIEMFMGHHDFDATTDIYAPFDPGYLGAARAELEAIIDEIEAKVPGAFTVAGGNVVVLGRR